MEQSGFELSTPLRLFIAKLPANLAGYSELIKAAELQRALSPCIRPGHSSLVPASCATLILHDRLAVYSSFLMNI
jgi:hypothetical protein